MAFLKGYGLGLDLQLIYIDLIILVIISLILLILYQSVPTLGVSCRRCVKMNRKLLILEVELYLVAVFEGFLDRRRLVVVRHQLRLRYILHILPHLMNHVL